MPREEERKDIQHGSPDPTRDYLPAGILSEYIGLAASDSRMGHSLTSTTDDVMAEFGFNIYDEMMKDPKVSKCINILKTYTLSDGLEIIPVYGENHDEYPTAFMIAEFCRESLQHLERPLKKTLEQMLDALIYGYKVAEITYQIKEIEMANQVKTALIPKHFKVKPFGQTRFVVDKTFSVLGIVGSSTIDAYKNNERIEQKKGLEMIGDNSIIRKSDGVYINLSGKEQKFVSRDKFLVLTVRDKDEDPRGRSLLRPAFNAWHIKNQIYPEYFRYLLVCAIPLIVGFTPPDEGVTTDIVRDADGNAVLNEMGQFIKFNPVVALRNALMDARNASALALKGGSKVQEIANNGNNGVAFAKALETFNEEIEMSILLQTLATSESRFQTRAASQVHMTVLDTLVFGIKGMLIDMLAKDLFEPMIKYNFGSEYLKYIPKMSLGDTERREFSTDAAAIAALYSAGYLSEDQKRHLDAQLGLPVRDNNYNAFKHISPTEALQVTKATLELTKLEADIDKVKQEANTQRIKQLVELKNIMLEGNPNADTSNIQQLIDQIVSEAINDTVVKDENRILDTLLDAGKRAQYILGASDAGVGDINRQTNLLPADSSQSGQGPSSGTPTRAPYIPTKNKPASFSWIKNTLDSFKSFWG